jgi:TolA-binding protein
MLPGALESEANYASARDTLLGMSSLFGCFVPEDIDSLSINPERANVKQNGAVSNASKMPQRLMSATENNSNKKRSRIKPLNDQISSVSKSSPFQLTEKRDNEVNTKKSRIDEDSSTLTSRVTTWVELMEDGREKEQL